ncbi:hypothetical protein [Deinococcus aestuarii]|uniref:hypothetical protein n=1 Tax=Deinococcus aestuarii TaxID=2774531 RepID=UPI001C0B299E|nr:hypothetical protein [Deinococcus aestuarii]
MTARTEPRPAQVTFLSDLITDVPTERRQRFIVNLKNAIRTNVFDGAPVDHTFDMEYVGRGKNSKPETKTSKEREYAVEKTPEFQAWLEKQTSVPVRVSQFVTKEAVLSGTISMRDLADKFRRRTGNRRGKRK